MQALDRIYSNLKNGAVYGKDLTNVRYPCFWPELWSDGKLICYRHYGSSAIKQTKKELLWLLNTIFEVSPEEFERTYKINS